MKTASMCVDDERDRDKWTFRALVSWEKSRENTHQSYPRNIKKTLN